MDANRNMDDHDRHDANRDPLSGEAGAHPVGTGVGAAGAGAVGAAIGGVLGGPIGAVIGSAIGAVAGGLAGKSAAEAINPTEEDDYWSKNYNSRPYVEPSKTYEDYKPAYQTGYEGYSRYADTEKTYEEVEPELQRDYQTNVAAASKLPWEAAKPAARDAYLKLYEERLVADKQRVKAADVTVGKRVETETARVSVPVEKERVVIERITPSGGGTAVAPGTVNFGEGQVSRIEVYEETANVSKQAFVREEIKVTKEVDRETVEAQEELRREVLDVDAGTHPVVQRTDTPPRV